MRWHSGVWLTLAFLTLLGCSDAPQQHRKQVTFAITGKPASLHPILATDAQSERIAALLFSPLIEFDAAQQPIPGQVGWQQLGPREYLLTLEPGLRAFSDGRTPNADDVVATVRAARELPGSPHAGTLQHVDAITALDASRVRIILSRPDPRLAEKLHLGLMPAAWFEDPRQLARTPVGNGHFDWLAWHDNGVQIQRRRDGLVVRFEAVPDPTMRALKLIRGEALLAQNDLPGEISDDLAARSPLVRVSEAGNTFSYLGFNLADPITGDWRVRAAIAHAIDREAIVRHLFKGQAVLTQTLLRPSHWAAGRDLLPYAYDPERARALLAGMGFGPENPLELSYKTSTDPFRVRIATVFQAQLKAVGIKLNIQSYEWGTFFGDIKAGRFQMYSLSWVGIRSPDIFRHVYHSHSLPPAGANRGRFVAEEMDSLIEQADGLPAEQAFPLYQQIQSLAHQRLIYVPLWHENQQLISRGLAGARPDSMGSYRFLEGVSFRHE